jgi:hypothetical protein
METVALLHSVLQSYKTKGVLDTMSSSLLRMPGRTSLQNSFRGNSIVAGYIHQFSRAVKFTALCTRRPVLALFMGGAGPLRNKHLA